MLNIRFECKVHRGWGFYGSLETLLNVKFDTPCNIPLTVVWANWGFARNITLYFVAFYA